MSESETDAAVTIELDRAQATALFEWAQRFMERGNIQLTHPADAVAVDSLASALEWALPEVLTEEYPSLLSARREAVVRDYRSRMEPRHCSWLDEMEYQDVE